MQTFDREIVAFFRGAVNLKYLVSVELMVLYGLGLVEVNGAWRVEKR